MPAVNSARPSPCSVAAATTAARNTMPIASCGTSPSSSSPAPVTAATSAVAMNQGSFSRSAETAMGAGRDTPAEGTMWIA